MNFPDLLVLAFFAMMLFGPKRLPEIARLVGKTMAELRRASNEFKNSLEEEIRNIEYQDTVKKAEAALPPGGEEETHASEAIEAYEPYAHHTDYTVATDPYAMMAGRDVSEEEEEMEHHHIGGYGEAVAESGHPPLAAHEEATGSAGVGSAAQPEHAAAQPAGEAPQEHERGA